MFVVMFVNTVTHSDGRGTRSARREKRAYQAHAHAQQRGSAGCIGD
jgi:hypothetical protein